MAVGGSCSLDLSFDRWMRKTKKNDGDNVLEQIYATEEGGGGSRWKPLFLF